MFIIKLNKHFYKLLEFQVVNSIDIVNIKFIRIVLEYRYNFMDF